MHELTTHIINHIVWQILFDFDLTYKEASRELIANWPTYSQKMRNVLEIYNLDGSFSTMWPKEVETFLMLLKLLPVTAQGSSSLPTGIPTFNESAESLIVFRSCQYPLSNYNDSKFHEQKYV